MGDSNNMHESICQIPPETKVLVTGATGFTGAVVTRKLVEAGLNVNALARHSSDISQFEGLEIKWYRGDVADEQTVSAAAEDVEYIFHIAAAFRDAKSTEADYHRIHVTSTELLVKYALANPNFKRFIHISTIGVHGHIEDPQADENYRFSPGDGYQRTKLVAEKWLKEWGDKNEFPYTIIRPAAIYGPGDRRLVKLFKMAKWKYFPLLGKGKCYYHLIHVDDLSNAIILSATKPEALGNVFIVGNPGPIPTAEIARIVAGVMGRKLGVIRLPVGPFFVAADICEALCRPFRIEPPIYRRRVAFYTKDRMFNTQKLRNVLGYQTRYSNEEGIVQTANWYIEKGWLKK
jgi:nucleoside-diphosphate-sugar epimerase